MVESAYGSLARELKGGLGCGATVEDGDIHVQGAQVDRVGGLGPIALRAIIAHLEEMPVMAWAWEGGAVAFASL